jgi:hypothetical protein
LLLPIKTSATIRTATASTTAWKTSSAPTRAPSPRDLLVGIKSGNTFTFTHPQNATPASDLTASYSWSKDLASFLASGATDGAGTNGRFHHPGGHPFARHHHRHRHRHRNGHQQTLRPGECDPTLNNADGAANFQSFELSVVGGDTTAPLRIMPMGDSITVGYTNADWTGGAFEFGYRSGLYTLLSNAGYDFRFIGNSTEPWTYRDPRTTDPAWPPTLNLGSLGQDGNNGYAGKTASFLNTNIASWLASQDPDIILLKIGTNSLDQSGLQTLVNTITTTEPDCHVIIAQIMPAIETLGFGPGNYSHWIRGFSGVGGQTGLNDDPDGDGIDNGVENFFDTNPGVSSSGVVAVSAGGGIFTFTHPQNATPASDLTATYTWSKDLAAFLANGATDGAGTTVDFTTQADTPSPGITTVTATVTGTAAGKLFVRVNVTQP